MRTIAAVFLVIAFAALAGCGGDKNTHFTNLSSRGALQHKNEGKLTPLKQQAKLDDNKKSSSASRSKDSRSKDSVQFEPIDNSSGGEKVPSRSSGGGGSANE